MEERGSSFVCVSIGLSQTASLYALLTLLNREDSGLTGAGAAHVGALVNTR